MVDTAQGAKRPIDHIRDSAISMEIVVGDGGGMPEVVTVGDSLYVVRGDDIYTMILADQIDPQRTNALVPNAQQKVCDYGANDKIVGATLLTAKSLIQSKYLAELDHRKAMQFVFNCTQELIGLRSIAEKLNIEIESALNSLDTNRAKFIVPHTTNLISGLRSYFEKTKQLFNQWFELIKILFPDVSSGQPTKLLKYFEVTFPGEHPFKAYLNHSLIDFEYLSNCRNAIIHPKAGVQELKIFDYALKPNHTIMQPVFGLLYPNIEYRVWGVASFVSEMTLALTEYTEHLIALGAYYSPLAQDIAGFTKGLALIPLERQRYHVRYTYTIIIDGEERTLG